LRTQHRKQLQTHELAQSALDAISVDSGMIVLRYDDAYAWMRERGSERGSENADVEMCGPNSLPLSNDSLYVEAPRQTFATRKSEDVVRRRRTCWAA
jgi:hypothetical protein